MAGKADEETRVQPPRVVRVKGEKGRGLKTTKFSIIKKIEVLTLMMIIFTLGGVKTHFMSLFCYFIRRWMKVKVDVSNRILCVVGSL